MLKKRYLKHRTLQSIQARYKKTLSKLDNDHIELLVNISLRYPFGYGRFKQGGRRDYMVINKVYIVDCEGYGYTAEGDYRAEVKSYEELKILVSEIGLNYTLEEILIIFGDLLKKRPLILMDDPDGLGGGDGFKAGQGVGMDLERGSDGSGSTSDGREYGVERRKMDRKGVISEDYGDESAQEEDSEETSTSETSSSEYDGEGYPEERKMNHRFRSDGFDCSGAQIHRKERNHSTKRARVRNGHRRGYGIKISPAVVACDSKFESDFVREEMNPILPKNDLLGSRRLAKSRGLEDEFMAYHLGKREFNRQRSHPRDHHNNPEPIFRPSRAKRLKLSKTDLKKSSKSVERKYAEDKESAEGEQLYASPYQKTRDSNFENLADRKIGKNGLKKPSFSTKRAGIGLKYYTVARGSNPGGGRNEQSSLTGSSSSSKSSISSNSSDHYMTESYSEESGMQRFADTQSENTESRMVEEDILPDSRKNGNQSLRRGNLSERTGKPRTTGSGLFMTGGFRFDAFGDKQSQNRANFGFVGLNNAQRRQDDDDDFCEELEMADDEKEDFGF